MTTTRLNSLEEYGPSFQTKVISSLLTHKKFLLSIHDVLKRYNPISSEGDIFVISLFFNRYLLIKYLSIKLPQNMPGQIKSKDKIYSTSIYCSNSTCNDSSFNKI